MRANFDFDTLLARGKFSCDNLFCRFFRTLFPVVSFILSNSSGELELRMRFCVTWRAGWEFKFSLVIGPGSNSCGNCMGSSRGRSFLWKPSFSRIRASCFLFSHLCAESKGAEHVLFFLCFGLVANLMRQFSEGPSKPLFCWVGDVEWNWSRLAEFLDGFWLHEEFLVRATRKVPSRSICLLVMMVICLTGETGSLAKQ